MTEPTKAQRLAAYWTMQNDRGEYLYSSLDLREPTADELRRLDAENAAQRDEIARQKALHHDCAGQLRSCGFEKGELRDEIARLRVDAERYRWLAAYCRSTSEHWGGRWSIIIDGPAPKTHDSEDDLDAAIDAAMKGTK